MTAQPVVHVYRSLVWMPKDCADSTWYASSGVTGGVERARRRLFWRVGYERVTETFFKHEVSGVAETRGETT